MLNLSICFVYLLGIMGMGILSFKKTRTMTGFFLADRKMGKFFVTGSLVATIVGGSNTIGMAGLGFRQGLTGSLWLLVGSLGLFILAAFLAEKVRRFSPYTLPELMESLYDKRVKMMASVIICLSWVAIIAGQMIAAGSLLVALIPSSSSLLVVLFALVIIFYTVLGGQYSVIRTDIFQFMIIGLGILGAALMAINRAGGLEGMIEGLPGEFFSFPVGGNFKGVDLFSLIIMVGSAYLVGPDIYSRLFCAKDKKTARVSAFSAGVIIIPFAFLITALGMCARILFPEIEGDEAFPMIIKEVLPPGVGGLVTASLLAALMSSADTCLLTAGTILTMDICQPYYKHDLSERGLLILSRVVVVIVGILSLLIATLIKEVIPALLLGYTVFSSGLALPIIGGFYRDKLGLNPKGAIAAIWGGGGFALIGKFIGLNYCGLIGFIISGILLFVVSKMTQCDREMMKDKNRLEKLHDEH